MLNLRHFASASLLLATLGAPAAARAQGFPGIPVPPPPDAPPYAPRTLAEAPPPDWGRYEPGRWGQREPKQQWYGWQILLPTLASDAVFIGGVASSATFDGGLYVALAGLVGHGFSGPIVHLAHGHPLKALASLGLEAALPAAFLATALLSPCNGGDVCAGPLFAGLIGVPIALTAGAAIDSSALAWEDCPAAPARAGSVSYSLAPLMLPSLKVGVPQTPRPAGVALVGTF